MNSQDSPTFAIKTLGCKVNQYETQMMRERLVKEGFAERREDEICDFYIVNSCTVTHRADRDTRNLIHYFNRLNPEAGIIVAGCYAEKEEDRKLLADLPGVRFLLKNNEKEKITDIISARVSCPKSSRANSKLSITDFKGHDRAFIKVQDGCDYRCSYCKVRVVRGPSKSRVLPDILKEAEALIKKGFKEIVLTGVCLGAWGRDLEKKLFLTDLIEAVSYTHLTLPTKRIV